jgi:SAM-dependent methyltransferase
MGFYYPADYINYIGAVEDEPTRWRQWDRRYEFVKRRRAIEHLQPRGRLLDVGCATGLFLHEMQQAGWEVVGVEPNLGAARYAQERFALPVEIGTLRNVRLTDESFDVVTLWDVLEHLHTPWQDLVQVRRLLKNNGLLVLSLPNLESLERRWFGPTWLGWDLPRHLYSFPRPALVSALAELGFHVEQIRCIAGSYHAWLLSLRFHWQERYPQARWPKPALSALRCLPARFAAAPLFWAIGQARLASVITYFARRGGESSARSPSLSLPGEARG